MLAACLWTRGAAGALARGPTTRGAHRAAAFQASNAPRRPARCASSTAGGAEAAAAATLEPPPIPNGLVAILKPAGWTSQDVVSKIKGTLGAEVRRWHAETGVPKVKKKIKVGHGGTLDPDATGVLVVGIGSGCKALQAYLTGPKRYSARALLGWETTTLDASDNGEVTERMACDHVTAAMLEAALPQFSGDILQVPPMYSALKRNGKKLYELAREGVTVDRPPREVRACFAGRGSPVSAHTPSSPPKGHGPCARAGRRRRRGPAGVRDRRRVRRRRVCAVARRRHCPGVRQPRPHDAPRPHAAGPLCARGLPPRGPMDVRGARAENHPYGEPGPVSGDER